MKQRYHAGPVVAADAGWVEGRDVGRHSPPPAAASPNDEATARVTTAATRRMLITGPLDVTTRASTCPPLVNGTLRRRARLPAPSISYTWPRRAIRGGLRR